MRVEHGEDFDGDFEYNSDTGAKGEPEDHDSGDITLDYNCGADAGAMRESTSQGTPLDCDINVAALEALANKNWATFVKITEEQQVFPGCVAGYRVSIVVTLLDDRMVNPPVSFLGLGY
jgi:hypothetical protein